MKCDEVERRSLERLDGDRQGEPASDEALDEHLRSCASCRNFLESAERLVADAALPALDAGERRRLDRLAPSLLATPQLRATRGARRLGWAGAALAGLAAGTVGALLATWMGSSSPAPASAPRGVGLVAAASPDDTAELWGVAWEGSPTDDGAGDDGVSAESAEAEVDESAELASLDVAWSGEGPFDAEADEVAGARVDGAAVEE